MIDLKDLKSLVKVMVDNNLTEIELQDAKGERVSLKRPAPPGSAPGIPGTPGMVPGYPALQPAHSGPASTFPVAGATVSPPSKSETASSQAEPSAEAQLKPIPSPMVGTFYPAPAPDAKPFVKIGDKVSPDTVVCIIEAMKVFNEIKAETSGTIAKVLVEPGKAVEFGQPLFLLNPA